jgi:hypothetical protein
MPKPKSLVTVDVQGSTKKRVDLTDVSEQAPADHMPMSLICGLEVHDVYPTYDSSNGMAEG